MSPLLTRRPPRHRDPSTPYNPSEFSDAENAVNRSRGGLRRAARARSQNRPRDRIARQRCAAGMSIRDIAVRDGRSKSQIQRVCVGVSRVLPTAPQESQHRKSNSQNSNLSDGLGVVPSGCEVPTGWKHSRDGKLYQRLRTWRGWRSVSKLCKTCINGWDDFDDDGQSEPTTATATAPRSVADDQASPRPPRPTGDTGTLGSVPVSESSGQTDSEQTDGRLGVLTVRSDSERRQDDRSAIDDRSEWIGESFWRSLFRSDR